MIQMTVDENGKLAVATFRTPPEKNSNPKLEALTDAFLKKLPDYVDDFMVKVKGEKVGECKMPIAELPPESKN